MAFAGYRDWSKVGVVGIEGLTEMLLCDASW